MEVFSRSTFTEKNGRSDDAATRSTDGGGDGLNAVTRSTNVHAGGVTNMPSTVHASLMARCLYPPNCTMRSLILSNRVQYFSAQFGEALMLPLTPHTITIVKGAMMLPLAPHVFVEGAPCMVSTP